MSVDLAYNNNSYARSDLTVISGGYSCAGNKQENQDAFVVKLPKAIDLENKGIVTVIADGVSSASHAAQAAQLAVTQFATEYYATPDTWATPKSAAKVLTSLNQWLYSQSGFLNTTQCQWLTTFSSLILKSNTGYIFHVGDTRISQFRQSEFINLTREHNRKQGKRSVILTRALGADTHLEVDVHTLTLEVGDLYLLSTDGLHEHVSATDISYVLADLSFNATKSELEKAAKKLVDMAFAAGSNDNMSCLLVKVLSLPNQTIAEIESDLQAKIIPPVLNVGFKLDGYEILKVLHASTRSHLYLVKHPLDDKAKVLKAPSSNFAEDMNYLQGFVREGWVGQRINHNHIMRIEQPQNTSQFLYHICEYIEGQTLAEWMHDNPSPTIAEVRQIIGQIISALRVFQRADIVHRDLKPDNVMIDKHGQITLIDYGTVAIPALDENQKTLVETCPQGSLNYIAPETMLTLKADYQSDLFSLAVIAYEMLTHQLPYKPMTQAKIKVENYQQWKYRSARQYRPDLPIWLDLCLQRGTKAEPSLRYQAFSEFFNDFSKPNLSAVEEYKSQPLIERNPVRFWQAVSFILAILLIASVVHT